MSDPRSSKTPPSVPTNSFTADPETTYAFVARFFSTLREIEVEHVVISPGSRSTPLAVVADQMRGLRTWLELDERAAAFFALGLAKATGRPAVLVCTSGTAAANYLPAIVEAHYSRVPMLVMTADRPPELQDWGAGQTIDQTKLYGDYARWSVGVPIPAAGPDALRYAEQLATRAVDRSIHRPAGAVHLNWPLREPLAPPSGRISKIVARAEGDRAVPRFTRVAPSVDPGDVRELVALARGHERGVLCCGPLPPDPELRVAVAAFASAAGWPVLTDPASNLRSGVETTEAPWIDLGDVMTRSPAFCERMEPDVVLRLGETPVSKAQRLWLEASNPESIWWLDQGGHWGEPSHRVTRVVRSDAAGLLAAAAAELVELGTDRPRRETDWCQEFEALSATARETLETGLYAEGESDEGFVLGGGDSSGRGLPTSEGLSSGQGLCGLEVARLVAERAAEDSQIFVSNSLSIRLMDLALANRVSSLNVFASRGASGIDGITSTALGLAAARGCPTTLLTGDLAFLHDLGGLLLAVRERLPLSIVVIDDDGGGIFSLLPIAEQAEAVGFQRLFRTPQGVDLAQVAALFSLDYHRIENGSSSNSSPTRRRSATKVELESALLAAADHDGVSLVHVRMDADQNAARFGALVRQAYEAVDARVVQ